MSTGFQSVGFLLLAIAAGCASSEPEAARTLEDSPAVFIRQYPDYPMLGRDSVFEGGLVAALWSDGRMIRPVSKDSIRDAYVEGVVSPTERKDALDAPATGPAIGLARRRVTLAGASATGHSDHRSRDSGEFELVPAVTMRRGDSRRPLIFGT